METYLVHPDKLQEKALKAFLKAMQVPYEKKSRVSTPSQVIKGVKKGQEDIEAGRKVSLEEFKARIA